MKRIIYDTCAECGDPIYLDEERYEMPDGDVICWDCLERWAKKYKHCGEVDLGYDE